MKPVDVHGNMLCINLDHPPPETTKVATHFFWERGTMDVIFAWKWTQNIVNTDVFCIWWLWNLGAFFCILFCNDARKTLAGTKKQKQQSTISQNIGRHGGSRILSRCWDLCFLFFLGACEGLVHLVDVFFLVPVNVWWRWSLKTVTGTKKKAKHNLTKHCSIAPPGNYYSVRKCKGLYGSFFCY
jgi:hypothetical protein